MGRVISEICLKNPETKVIAGVDISTECKFDYPVYDSFDKVNEEADVVIDFSNPKALPELIKFCTLKKLPVVICTTGLSDDDLALIDEASGVIPVFRSGNMSLGINVLMMLAKRAAQILGENFDVEIIERHHNQKLDAPSGTAIMIAEALEQVLPYQAERVYDRHCTRAKRAYNEIGMHSLRGGTIVGEHEVVFAGRDEVIEIKHTAQSREVFASGAIKAAIFLSEIKRAGKYSMNELVSRYTNL